MTLRSKFIYLILGSLIIPVLSMMGAYVFIKSVMSLDDPALVVREIDKNLDKVEGEGDLNALTESFGDSYFSLIIDESELIDSTRSVFSEGEGEGDSFRPQIIIHRFYRILDDGRQVMILVGVDFLETKRLFFPLTFLLSSLVVLSLISLLIIRSINNSISRLEESTRQIAEGNLDVEIDLGAQDKFGSLARSLDTMREQIKMEYDRRNRFFMGVSHDLKTPLASITGYADALLEGMAEDRDAMDKYLGIIKDKSLQLEQGITRLIHYLKLSNYDFQASLEKKSLSEFLRAFLEVQSEEAGFHGDTLEGKIDLPDDLLLPFDEELLARALENLIQNAYRYGREKEPVSFSCCKDYGNVVITVENKGEKIPRDKLNLLFEPFYRGDQSRRSDGFGLGLASVKSIVESHDWSITVESTESITRFSVLIPSDKFRRNSQ